MGFNKRFIDDERVKSWLEKKLPLSTLFKADALIFEGSLPSKVYDMFKDGINEEEILKRLNDESSKLQ